APSASQGVWTFGHLMRELAPTPAQAPAMTLQLFQHWLTDQTVNGFTVAARPAMQQVLLDVWPKTATGELDLDQPPLTLQAIVNRIDVRNLAAGSAGEGRFVFAVNGAGFPQSFTVILEYNLPAKTQKDVQAWANLWHGLSSHPFPSEAYNAALEAITRRFSGRNAAPGAPNGSALLELRTNEIALSGFQWELRAFELSPSSGFFDEIALKETPDLSFDLTQTFADFVNQNAAAIIAEVPGANDNTVALTFEGLSFRAGSIFNSQIEWFGPPTGPGIADPNARFHASANTCNGCHGPETGTPNFTMINPRSAGTEAVLSPFLTGATVTDPVTGQNRMLDDLGRRHADLTSLVCPADGGSQPPPDAGGKPTDAGLTSP
ncbi:MAG TPA: LamG domain-containing protein, partial [Polyangiaceae bacterium]|nr:LamG domain-containing protein [Polyangiaceae bacterium]